MADFARSTFGEKKLENVNIRMSGTMVNDIDGLANMLGMNRSEWVCSVIQAALDVEETRYIALKSIFGDKPENDNANSVKQRNTNQVMPDGTAPSVGES